MFRINSKLELLKVLHDHIQLSLKNADVNPKSRSDIMDMIWDMKDKKKLRDLKLINKKLEKWIKDYHEIQL
jgi:hypothetical protein